MVLFEPPTNVNSDGVKGRATTAVATSPSRSHRNNNDNSSTGDNKVARGDTRAASSNANKGGNRTLRRAKKVQSINETEKGTAQNSGKPQKTPSRRDVGEKKTKGLTGRSERVKICLGFRVFHEV